MSRKRETNKYISQKRKGTNKIHRKEAKKKRENTFQRETATIWNKINDKERLKRKSQI